MQVPDCNIIKFARLLQILQITIITLISSDRCAQQSCKNAPNHYKYSTFGDREGLIMLQTTIIMVFRSDCCVQKRSKTVPFLRQTKIQTTIFIVFDVFAFFKNVPNHYKYSTFGDFEAACRCSKPL